MIEQVFGKACTGYVSKLDLGITESFFNEKEPAAQDLSFERRLQVLRIKHLMRRTIQYNTQSPQGIR